ncbi:MAG TPA: hypothetical protein VLJ44_00305 [Gaiellaceae bacterium]|nr:hypothetical protein [Gaiellaceae bacterium]
MSSAGATVETAAVVTTSVRGKDATRAATVLALLAVMQIAWIGVLVYGAIWLLT